MKRLTVLFALLLLWSAAGQVSAQSWRSPVDLPTPEVEFVDAFAHFYGDGSIWHAVWTRDVTRPNDPYERWFLSIAQVEGLPYYPETSILAEVAEFDAPEHVGWLDANGDGVPDYVWTHIEYWRNAATLVVNILDVENGMRFRMTWSNTVNAPPTPVRLDFAHSPPYLDRAADQYLYGWLAGLTKSEQAREVVVLDPQAEGARGPTVAAGVSVAVEPWDLCGGYAVSFEHLVPQDAFLQGVCDLEEVVARLRDGVAHLERWVVELSEEAGSHNVVFLMTWAQALANDLGAVLAVGGSATDLPPWQREVLRDWVLTEALLVEREARGALDSVLARDFGERWEVDKLEARRECRAPDAESWCGVARGFGFLD